MNRLVKISLFLAATCLLCLALLWSWRERGELRRENQALREAGRMIDPALRETASSNPPIEARPTPPQAEELARFQQDHEELLRLRNQVRELRDQLAAANARSSSFLKSKSVESATMDNPPGEMFLEENSRRADVVTLPSGLQFKVLTPGAGPVPGSNDTVKTHYRGSLIDGTMFDSSYERDAPSTFPVQAVIKGWREALQLMPVGSKWQLFIPANLAYGERAVGPKIPANSVLLFDVELLAIESK